MTILTGTVELPAIGPQQTVQITNPGLVATVDLPLSASGPGRMQCSITTSISLLGY